ncbi:MAG: hypothetical protein ACYCW6_26955 [Candidatus Xenobia bacterium]
MSRLDRSTLMLMLALVLVTMMAPVAVVARPSKTDTPLRVVSPSLFRGLHLTPEQGAQLDSLLADQRNNITSYWNGFRAEVHRILTPAQEAKLAQLKHRLDWQTYVGLTAEQISRFELLQSQQTAVPHRQVVSELRLTPEQQARLAEYEAQREDESHGRIPQVLGLTADQIARVRAWNEGQRSQLEAQQHDFVTCVDTVLSRKQQERFHQNLNEMRESQRRWRE